MELKFIVELISIEEGESSFIIVTVSELATLLQYYDSSKYAINNVAGLGQITEKMETFFKSPDPNLEMGGSRK